jgi:DNA polymerase-3 subunit alpha (Gram-positive type)
VGGLREGEVLRAQGCSGFIEGLLEEYFSARVKVEFTDPDIDEEARDEYLSFIESEEVKAANNLADEEKKQSNAAGGRKLKSRGAQMNEDELDIILGKSFKDSFIKIAEVTQDSGKVAVTGTVFRVEFKEIRGDRFLCIFDLTDYTSSLTAKFFVEKDDIE